MGTVTRGQGEQVQWASWQGDMISWPGDTLDSWLEERQGRDAVACLLCDEGAVRGLAP